MAEADLSVHDSWIRHGAHGRSIATRLTSELLGLRDRPTAIVAASDTQALGVLEGLGIAGLSAPDDVSVVGFDDIDVAAYVGLTTVRQPLDDSGKRGAALLIEALSGRELSGLDERLALELVVRRTTAPPSHLRRGRLRSVGVRTGTN
jgi:LacI family transcriptional regulator